MNLFNILENWEKGINIDWEPFFQEVLDKLSGLTKNRVFTLARIIEWGASSKEGRYNAIYLDKAIDILLSLARRDDLKLKKELLKKEPVEGTLNSPYGRVLRALIEISIRWGKEYQRSSEHRWNPKIQSFFTTQLENSMRCSELNVTVGEYLYYIAWLDFDWVREKIYLIFPHENNLVWYEAFTGYLHEMDLYKGLYQLLRDRDDYKKAIKELRDDTCERTLVWHVFVAYLEGDEHLNDDNSLLNQLFIEENFHYASLFVFYFWQARDKIDQNKLENFRPTWRKLIEIISNRLPLNQNYLKNELCRWLAIPKVLDDEIFDLIEATIPTELNLYTTNFFVETILKKFPSESRSRYKWISLLKRIVIQEAERNREEKKLLTQNLKNVLFFLIEHDETEFVKGILPALSNNFHLQDLNKELFS